MTNQENHKYQGLGKWLWFLRQLCPPALFEGIEGDLIEEYELHIDQLGMAKARQIFIWHLLKFFRPGILLRNQFNFRSINIIMWKSYIITSWRNLLKSKGYSLINIIGLALGIGVCLLTFNFVQYEKSYDSFHHDVERMYRINQTNIWDPDGGVFGSVGPSVAFALQSDFPEMEEITRINTPGGNIVRYTKPDGQVVAFNEDRILASDSNFFSFFNFKLREGTYEALHGRNKVVLSDKAAKRIFGDQPALGKIIQLGDDKISVEVTGVTEEQPNNSHFHFDYLLSMYTNPFIKEFEWSWVWTQTVTYVKLREDANPSVVSERLLTFADRHAPATFEKLNMDYKSFMSEKGGWHMYIQPVQDIYLHSAGIGNRIGPVGNIQYVHILSAVAIFILLIAVVNFVNLSTARGATRAKEVGVKKTLGLMRRSLVTQFQVEHIFITIISVLFGLVVMELLRKGVQPLTGIEIPSNWTSPMFIGVILVFPIVVGFLAGLYPSFYLTSFNPIQVLKGKVVSGLKSSGLRNTLIVFQFTISIGLMAATLIVFQQLNFFRSQSVGFDKENLLIIGNAEKFGNKIESFRNEIAELPGVRGAAISMDIRSSLEDIYSRVGDDKKLSISHYKIDEHFFSTTKLEMAAGRTFEIDRPSDKDALVINETLARLMNMTNEEVLGERISYLGDDVGPREIIGVTKDFHFQSLRQNIMPMMFMNIHSNMWGDNRIVTVRYEPETINELVASIEDKWKEMIPDEAPFDYSFYQEELKAQYQQEERLGSLFSIFTGLSILIAIVGLVGLVAYSAEVRKKEIGIRKVFGASISRLLILMNSQYIKLIVLSLAIATPLAWAALEQWLNTFAYRVTIGPLPFIVAGVAELLLALTCVGYLSLRATTANPVHVLKDE